MAEEQIDKNINDNLENSYVVLDIIREYTLFFNAENNCFGKSLFDEIDLLQLSSTNPQLESFYEHMNFFKLNENNEKTKLYKLNEIDFNNDLHIYGIYNEKTIECICVSYSLFALLIEIINLKNIKKNKKYFIKQIKNSI